MALWSRIGNAFRGDRLNRDIDEELNTHIAEALEQAATHSKSNGLLGRCYGSVKTFAMSVSSPGSIHCALTSFSVGGSSPSEK